MARAGVPGTSVDRLVLDLLERGRDDELSDELAGWLAGSPRFRAFAQANRDKIRKKLRGATDAEARADVRLELLVAHLLLADRRIDLAFEAYGSGKRGPDFTVTVRGERAFNLEVTRTRRGPDEAGFVRLLLAKLQQLPPSIPNSLLVAIDGNDAGALDVAAATRVLRARADGKDEAFFTTSGFERARRFYERYLRLGGVIVLCETAAEDARAAVWVNRSARIAIPERALSACLIALRSGASRSAVAAGPDARGRALLSRRG